MNDKIAKINVVIAELTLVAAKLQAGAPPASLATLLDQAKIDLAEAARSITGQNPIRGDTN
jgi:hypothetical protein